MSTVLEKPVLLDETGQAIVGKLSEIKDAIDNGGSEKYPVLIYIETMPTKTTYRPGELIDYTGIVVKAVFSNNVEYDITGQCTFSPLEGTPYVVESQLVTTMTVTASYVWHPTGTTFTSSFTLTWNRVKKIKVTTPPTKTTYDEGDQLDLTGIVVKKEYDDGTEIDITNDCTYIPAEGTVLSHNMVEVTIRYFDDEDPSGPTRQTWQTITVNEIPIYGVEWDETSSPVMTRTDAAANFTDPVPYYSGMNGNPSSPFDTISPWKDIERVTDSDAGILVKIPKFYYKASRVSGKFKLQISPIPQTGFYVSPAHQDRGDGNGERDFVYIGAYNCDADYVSATNSSLKGSMTRAEARTGIHSLGADIWQIDKAMLETIQMLYLVEYANWNTQEAIGYGCSNTGQYEVTGYTDSFNYHTGTNATSRQSWGHIKYRWIEDLWGNVRFWLDGVYLDNGKVYSIINPAYFSDDSGGTDTGFDLVLTSGDIKKMEFSNESGLEWFMWPTETITDSTFSSYICDTGSIRSTHQVLMAGGWSFQKYYYGMFYMESDSSTYYNGSIGARLMKLPANG